MPQALTLRLIKIARPNAQFEVLATSMLDVAAYPAADFGELYRKSWGIEEGFSGELPESIEQEVLAKFLLHNIVQAVRHQAHRSLPSDKQVL